MVSLSSKLEEYSKKYQKYRDIGAKAPPIPKTTGKPASRLVREPVKSLADEYVEPDDDDDNDETDDEETDEEDNDEVDDDLEEIKDHIREQIGQRYDTNPSIFSAVTTQLILGVFLLIGAYLVATNNGIMGAVLYLNTTTTGQNIDVASTVSTSLSTMMPIIFLVVLVPILLTTINSFAKVE